MPRSFDIVRARRAVADLRAIGVSAAAKKYKVTERTLWMWQKRLRESAAEGELPVMVALPKGLGSDWRGKLRAALGVGLDRLAQIAASETDPDKLSRALERLAEVEVTAEALGVGTAGLGEGGEPSSDQKKN